MQRQAIASEFLIAADMFGTFIFALSGATVGVKKRLDLFGMMVLAFVAGNAGGILRDLLIGATPPLAIRDWRYLAVSALVCAATFFWHPNIHRLRTPILLFDGGGLALFAVTGTQEALNAGLNPLMAALMGMLSGVGGGILRDVLVAETPAIFESDLYAVAALGAGVIVVLGQSWQVPVVPTLLAAAGTCFWLRVMAITRGWHLPAAWQRSQE